MIKKYIKKSIPIEAIQWTGLNRAEIVNFAHSARFEYTDIEPPQIKLYIHTLEGNMYAHVGDYIIKGIHGECYPCQKTIFEETYEEI